jgi:hypothetical protein
VEELMGASGTIPMILQEIKKCNMDVTTITIKKLNKTAAAPIPETNQSIVEKQFDTNCFQLWK